MTTPEEIRASWSDANIRGAFEREYQAHLASLPPREARRKDKAVRRSEWRMRHNQGSRIFGKIICTLRLLLAKLHTFLYKNFDNNF